jgi:hypothetical protein
MTSHGPVNIEELSSGSIFYAGGARFERKWYHRYEMLTAFSMEMNRILGDSNEI